MLEKKYRIERNQITYILKKGKDSVSKLFIIRYIENNKGFNRYCSVVSKKLYTRAVDRNKLRRQIYEAIRLSSKNIKPHKKHFDMVLIPKKSIIGTSYEKIEEDVKEIINQHG